MSFSPQLFLSNIKAKDGLAKPSRFEVILPIPAAVNNNIGNSVIEQLLNLPNSIFTDISSVFASGGKEIDSQSKTTNASMSRYLALQCEATELPGKTLQTADAKVYGPIFKVPYQTNYTETAFTFLCTNQFYERKLFEKWMECIMPTDTNNLRFPKGDKSRYMANIKIVQYDDFIKRIFAIELIDAYPIGISSQPLSWSEDGFHRVTAQFTYQKYRVIYDGGYDVGAAIAALVGVKSAGIVDRAGNAINNSIADFVNKVF
jgi:hypothetical protein